MPFIEFLTDYTVKSDDGASYQQGQVVELPEASAEHFTRRSLAVLCDPPTSGAAPPAPEPEAVVEEDDADPPRRKRGRPRKAVDDESDQHDTA